MTDVGELIARAYREEWARVVATLARRFGDLNIAEEMARPVNRATPVTASVAYPAAAGGREAGSSPESGVKGTGAVPASW